MKYPADLERLISYYKKLPGIGERSAERLAIATLEFKDEEIKQELYKSILKRSIYEYLMVIKYDKSVENNGLTIEEIDDKIKFIEEIWVK